MKKKMYIGAMLVAVLLTACEDQLQEKTFNFYSDRDYFADTDRLNMAVLGVYEVFSEMGTYGQYWMAYDTDTDISHVSGAGTGHVTRDLGHYNAYVEHPWLEESWRLYYLGIDRANTILERLQDVTTDGSPADSARLHRLAAETKCLRAMAYFDLTLLFGDVPLKVTYSTSEDNFNLERTDREAVYDRIVADFREAIPALPWHDEMAAFDGRLTRGAAIGLLARVYLFRGGYSLRQDGTVRRPANYRDCYRETLNLTEQIIASGRHGLNDSYEQVFRNMCEYVLEPRENICEVQFFNPTGETKHSSVMGTYNGPSINISSSFGRANSFIKTHQFFAQTFDRVNDTRYPVAIADFEINASDQIRPIAERNSHNWAPGKWRRNWHAGRPKENNNTDVNVVLLRYADILLMRAEVENELNGTDAALEYINQVRRRAYGQLPYTQLSAIDYLATDFTGPDDFFRELRAERARELCFEGMRRMDLIRWNLLGTALQETKAKFETAIAAGTQSNYNFAASANRFTPGKHELYPIPARERRETGNSLTQNPGYAGY
ncbi:MAG: RagB/SusD family nutrient uptake outer membrane protein [Tannerella sp.]|jgi:hypothetical protein|nr:RagB/SusD family nutrient uptake outer membrane protein [Tannerella sp.]